MDELKLLLSKAEDCVRALKKGRPFVFTDFLSVEQQKTVMDFLKPLGVKSIAFGGYPDAERLMICVYSDYAPELFDFPLRSISFKLSRNADIGHRDVLGSVMSLGIKRETVGDIIFFDDLCVIFASEKICEFILQNLTSVKKIRVNPEIYCGEIKYQKEFEEINAICSSLRLDCVISEIASFSRTKASEYIEGGLVLLNGGECLKKDKIIAVDDIISIRKKGKYRIAEFAGKTKKDRLKIKILKYK